MASRQEVFLSRIGMTVLRAKRGLVTSSGSDGAQGEDGGRVTMNSVERVSIRVQGREADSALGRASSRDGLPRRWRLLGCQVSNGRRQVVMVDTSKRSSTRLGRAELGG